MDRVDLWHARLALTTLRLDQRQAIAEAAEGFLCISALIPQRSRNKGLDPVV